MLIMQTDILKKKMEINTWFFDDSADENKELLKKYKDFWNGIKSKIIEITVGECDYGKDYMKI